MLIYKITLQYFNYNYVVYSKDLNWGIDTVLTEYIHAYYETNLYRPSKHEIEEVKNNIYTEDYKLDTAYRIWLSYERIRIMKRYIRAAKYNDSEIISALKHSADFGLRKSIPQSDIPMLVAETRDALSNFYDESLDDVAWGVVWRYFQK